MEHDILIIGGGPSGLSTALHLARDFPQLASRILILEKAHYPRPKLCAGGLVIDAEVILQRLGLDVREVPHADASRIHFDFEAKGLSIRVPKRHALRVIRRDEFDNWLARKTKSRGIEIREGVTVRNIIPDKSGMTVQTDQGDFHAQVLVGADGSNGVTRRCLFPNAPVTTARVLEVLTPEYDVIARSQWPSSRAAAYRDRDDEAISTPIQEEIASGRPSTTPLRGFAQDEHPRNTCTCAQCRCDRQREGTAFIDFFPVSSNIAGYVWDFPTQVKGKAMRCWGIYDTNLLASKQRPQLKEPLAKEMARLGLDLDQCEIKGFPIRLFSPENRMSAPHVLLVGDAAGADPFLGEGISFALGYGALAAREIGKAFRRNEFSFNGYRRRVLSSALGQALLARWVLAQFAYLFKWKWFQILAWRLLKPVTILLAWIFVLNWGKRMSSTL